MKSVLHCSLTALAAVILIGCGGAQQSSRVAAIANVEVYAWRTSSAVNTWRVLVDGQETRSGEVASASNDLALAVVHNEHNVEFAVRIGGDSTSATVDFEPGAGQVDAAVPGSKALGITGATSIYRMEQKNASGEVAKTIEVVVESK